MYPLHLNYVTTLPRKTITMKITIFIIVLVLKSNETWKFGISDCHSLYERVQCPASSSSRDISSRTRDIPVLAHAMSGLSIIVQGNLPMTPEIN